jgi:hypothetical protein
MQDIDTLSQHVSGNAGGVCLANVVYIHWRSLQRDKPDAQRESEQHQQRDQRSRAVMMRWAWERDVHQDGPWQSYQDSEGDCPLTLSKKAKLMLLLDFTRNRVYRLRDRGERPSL